MDTLVKYFTGSTFHHIERSRGLLVRIPPGLPNELYPLAQTCHQMINQIIKEFQELVDDPPEERLRRFRRAVYDLNAVETIALPALERFNERDDVFLNRLVGRIKKEIDYPLLPPVVTSLSQEYFHIYQPLNLLFVPLSEGDSLLHLPDLYHELGHPLLTQTQHPKVKLLHRAAIEGLGIALEYLQVELEKEDRRRSPRAFSYYLKNWRNSWGYWIIELFCDLFAIHTIGPAFAWAHLHLWAKLGDDPFEIPLFTTSSHPADQARMTIMLYGLRNSGFSDVGDVIKTRWEEMISISGMKPEPEYFRCFPDSLLEKIADKALAGFQAMGCKITSPSTNGPIFELLNQAWSQFWQNPTGYAEWEHESVNKLRKECGLSE